MSQAPLTNASEPGLSARRMIRGLLKRVFGCQHRRLSRPITPSARPGSSSTYTYVVCLDCGEHFSYDWKAMKIGRRIEQPPPSTW